MQSFDQTKSQTGIKSLQTRLALLKKIQQLPPIKKSRPQMRPNPSTWSIDDICYWLRENGASHLCVNFSEAEFDAVELIEAEVDLAKVRTNRGARCDNTCETFSIGKNYGKGTKPTNAAKSVHLVDRRYLLLVTGKRGTSPLRELFRSRIRCLEITEEQDLIILANLLALVKKDIQA